MTAPLHGTLRHPAHRFVLGAFDVTTLLDGTIVMGVSPPFMLDESDDEIAAIAGEARLPIDQLENNFVPALVNTGESLVLFDTGCGHYRRDKGAGFLLERLGDAGYAPSDVDVVAFTHVHPDHIGGVVRRWRARLSERGAHDRSAGILRLEIGREHPASARREPGHVPSDHRPSRGPAPVA